MIILNTDTWYGITFKRQICRSFGPKFTPHWKKEIQIRNMSGWVDKKGPFYKDKKIVSPAQQKNTNGANLPLQRKVLAGVTEGQGLDQPVDAGLYRGLILASEKIINLPPNPTFLAKK